MEADEMRAALFAVVQGCQKLVGSEAFPNRSVEQAALEVTRTLGENADRRPTFTLIVCALRFGNPAPFLDLIGRICGVRWERVVGAAAHELAEVKATLSQVRAALDAAEERVAAVGERMARGAA